MWGEGDGRGTGGRDGAGSAESRLKHSRDQELLIYVVESVKIANHRLQDLLEESPIGARR